MDNGKQYLWDEYLEKKKRTTRGYGLAARVPSSFIKVIETTNLQTFNARRLGALWAPTSPLSDLADNNSLAKMFLVESGCDKYIILIQRNMQIKE